MHTYQRENGSVPQISISCIQPPAHRAVSSVIGGTEKVHNLQRETKQTCSCANPAISGMWGTCAQLKSIRCGTLFLVTPAKAKRARSPKPDEQLKSSCSSEVFVPEPRHSAMNHYHRYRIGDEACGGFDNAQQIPGPRANCSVVRYGL
jgi:hypothetical protein